MVRLRFSGLLLVGGLLALCGCPRPAAHERPIRFAVHSDPLSLDPQLHNEILTYSILSNIYEGLTRFDTDLRLLPSLAERWENPDETTWRFVLREGARFHDGRPVEAEDVARSLLRAKHHPRSGFASYLVPMTTARALDRRTVEVRTSTPFAAFLNKLNFVFVVPRDTPETMTAFVGSGPYRLARYEKGKLLELQPAPGDPRARSLLPLEFLPVPDPRDRVALLEKGEVDAIQDFPVSRVEDLKSEPSLRTLSRASTVVEYLHLLATDPRFTDPRVREAISLALDRRLLVERRTLGFGQPASQIVGPGVFGHDPSLTVPARDLPRARQLLAEAGHPGGLDLVLEHRDSRDATEVMRQLGEAGIRVTSRPAAWRELFTRLEAGEVSFYFGGVSAPSGDASDILDSFVHSRDAGRSYGRTNHTRLAIPELDALIEEAGTTLSAPARLLLLQKSMRLVTSDRHLIPVSIPYDIYGVRRDLAWKPRLDRLMLGAEMRRLP
ncbi:MAG: hypothetical protein JNK60_12220 [Acidobacteria bacterium]|nr:hypothetical protein [Acidobacteriota bacterium]